jgi:hypothetical protein
VEVFHFLQVKQYIVLLVVRVMVAQAVSVLLAAVQVDLQ